MTRPLQVKQQTSTFLRGSLQMRRVITVVSAVVLFLGVGTGIASAGTNGPIASTGGSTAQFLHSGDIFRICDTNSDGNSVYVKFHYSGSGGDVRLNWTGGSGTCTDRPYNIGEGKTVYYTSCISDTLWDTCSGEKSGVA
jgi:hypothetical protein